MAPTPTLAPARLLQPAATLAPGPTLAAVAPLPPRVATPTAPPAPPQPTATAGAGALPAPPAATGPTPLPGAITVTVPLGSVADVTSLAARPEVDELLLAARRYPGSRIYLAAYADEAEARSQSTDATALSNQLVLEMARYLDGRGIDASRISGKGMGANPNVGRAVVVTIDVEGAPAGLEPSARQLAEREAAALAPDRLPRQNTIYKDVAGMAAYRIGIGDELRITQWFAAGAQKHRVIVGPTGTITFDLVPEAPVAGLTVIEAQEVLANRLKRYVRSPRLAVDIVTFASRRVTVITPDGAQSVLLTGRTTILDLLGRERIAPAAADLKSVRVVRGQREFSVNVFRAAIEGDWRENLVLDDGDVIYLPTFAESGSYVLVLGAVKAPGIYPMRTRMSAVDAVFTAGGVTPDGYLPHARIIRGDLEKPEFLPADVDLVIDRGQTADHRELRGGDVIFVPRTRIANWNRFIADLTPTLNLALQPFGGLGSFLLLGRTTRTTQQTNIIIAPTPPVPPLTAE